MPHRKTPRSIRPTPALGPYPAWLGLILLSAFACRAQVAIAPFKLDYAGAFAFTFDDALPSQLIYAVPYLNQVGLKGSFYLITGNVADGAAGGPAIGKQTVWADWKAVADSGHEIGSHTLTHRDLTAMTAEEAAQELTGSAQAIRDKLGITPVTLAYPYNAWNLAVHRLALKTYVAARLSQVGYGDVAGFAATAAAMNGYADAAVAGKKLQIGMIHGLTEPYAPMDTAQFLEHLKYCRKLMDEGKLWVATFGEISKYRIERDSTTVAVQTQAGMTAAFTAQSPLDTVLYNVPLTFLIPYTGAAPAGVVATRAGAKPALPVIVRAGLILVQAVPGPGLITVDWSPTAALAPASGDGQGDAAKVPAQKNPSGNTWFPESGCKRPAINEKGAPHGPPFRAHPGFDYPPSGGWKVQSRVVLPACRSSKVRISAFSHFLRNCRRVSWRETSFRTTKTSFSVSIRLWTYEGGSHWLKCATRPSMLVNENCMPFPEDGTEFVTEGAFSEGGG